MYSDDPIGVVLIDLNCLLANDGPPQIHGWFPIFDTLRGIQGQLRLALKVQFFGDVNPFKDSAAGVEFFSGTRCCCAFVMTLIVNAVSSLEGQTIREIHGFVEELVVGNGERNWLPLLLIRAAGFRRRPRVSLGGLVSREPHVERSAPAVVQATHQVRFAAKRCFANACCA